MYPKTSRGAFAALLLAGGVWAYRNSDKVKGWLNQLSSQAKTLSSPETERSFTGETRRIGVEYPGADHSDSIAKDI
jgi:hypothetical protein